MNNPKNYLWGLVAMGVLIIPLHASALSFSIADSNGINYTTTTELTDPVTGTGGFLNPKELEITLTGQGGIQIHGLEDAGNKVDGTKRKFQNALWFNITVVNDTDAPWGGFTLELQTVLGVSSKDSDGLSFAQGSTKQDKFGSTVFKNNSIRNNPDYITFTEGLVPSGASASFTNIIISLNGADDVFLVLTPEVGSVPDGMSTGVGLLTALMALFVGRGWMRRRN